MPLQPFPEAMMTKGSSMQAHDNDLPALTSSRICHDLASPLMAISNGLELLELSGFADTPEAALLSDSVRAARARMEFFRIAFGPGGDATMMSHEQCRSLVEGHYAETRIAPVWCPDNAVPRDSVKLLFLLIQCVASALPHGGEIRVTRADRVWAVSAVASSVRDIGSLWSVLSEGVAHSLAAAEVHFALAHAQAQTTGCRLATQIKTDGVCVTIH